MSNITFIISLNCGPCTMDIVTCIIYKHGPIIKQFSPEIWLSLATKQKDKSVF